MHDAFYRGLLILWQCATSYRPMLFTCLLQVRRLITSLQTLEDFQTVRSQIWRKLHPSFKTSIIYKAGSVKAYLVYGEMTLQHSIMTNKGLDAMFTYNLRRQKWTLPRLATCVGIGSTSPWRRAVKMFDAGPLDHWTAGPDTEPEMDAPSGMIEF